MPNWGESTGSKGSFSDPSDADEDVCPPHIWKEIIALPKNWPSSRATHQCTICHQVAFPSPHGLVDQPYNGN